MALDLEKLSMMRLALVISSLASGGAEKVMTTIADHYAEKSNPVTLITLGPHDTDFYKLHPGVKHVALNLAGLSASPLSAVSNNFRRARRLREEIRRARPDAVLSFMDTTNVLTLFATRGLHIPVIVSERTDPTQHRAGWIWERLRRATYPRAQAVVVQTKQLRSWGESMNRKDAVFVIPNPAAELACPANNDCESLPSTLPPGRRVVGMGRLIPAKGFDLLIRAFAQCAAKCPDWSLIIIGHGEERERLKSLAAELGIASRVSLPGQVDRPSAILRRADLFVLSSRYEGFPNALLEGMACGLPAICFDCPSGPREIMRDGVDGVLVPRENVAALAAAMERLMSNEEERKRLSLRAPEVTERFGLESIMKLWDALLHQVTGKTTP